MTDKFAICHMGLNGSFIKENGKIMDIERVVYLFNELSDENEQLKQHNTELINKIDFLERIIDGDV